MLDNVKHYFARWKESKNYKHDLDVLLEQGNSQASLQERLLWTVNLMEWVRYSSSNQDYSEIKNVKVPAARIRFLLMVLERNAVWKDHVAKTLRSIIRDVSALELFSEIGLPQEMSFLSELKNRIFLKIMPERPLREGMGNLFSAMFSSSDDIHWLSSLDPQEMNKIVELFHYNVSPEEGNWNGLRQDIEESVLCLVSQVRATGLTSILRKRMGKKSLREIPFFRLTSDLDSLIFSQNAGNKPEFLAKAKEYKKLIWSCIQSLQDVYRHLNNYGVNVTIVYHLESAKAKLRRIDDLVTFMMSDELDTEILLYFIIQLVQENQDRKSLRSLFDQNTRLLARKITDRSAETGEHYITRNKTDFRKMFQRALGGGFYTAFTVYIKFFIVSLHSALFMEGMLASTNYAVSFLAIQFSGFTLATKQPSMTGPALAAKMQFIDNGESVDSLIDEITYLIRTQVVGILGNVGMVIPTALVMDLAYNYFAGHHILSPEKAMATLDAASVLSFAPFFAFFTGILLWASSVFAGWMDNWFVFHGLKSTIMFNRKLNFIFDNAISEKIATFFEKNISAIAANVSLGILLGLIPEIFKFLGINIEVRHVTLSSGGIGAAIPLFGYKIFEMKEFWYAMVGVMVIGTLNVSVSFALAFWVAVRSRNIKSGQRGNIYKALWTRFKKNPFAFFFPTNLDSHNSVKDSGNQSNGDHAAS